MDGRYPPDVRSPAAGEFLLKTAAVVSVLRHLGCFELEFGCCIKILKFVSHVRIGAMDIKIASIALANDAILLTRNLNDFQKVPGLRVADWLS